MNSEATHSPCLAITWLLLAALSGLLEVMFEIHILETLQVLFRAGFRAGSHFRQQSPRLLGIQLLVMVLYPQPIARTGGFAPLASPWPAWHRTTAMLGDPTASSAKQRLMTGIYFNLAFGR